MANDPMTLLERLRNPAYHGSGLTRGKPADLDVKQTVADMAEAAAEIEESHKALRAISQIANLPSSDNTFGSLATRMEKVWLLSRNY